MKNIFMSLLLSFTLFSCKISTGQLENEVQNLMEEKFEEAGLNIKVNNISLVHKGGNDYTGLVILECEGEIEQFDINVICDGESFQYEIVNFE